ncbi:MAG: amidohydrolase family protein [Acidimicrobiia bacterium]
MTTKLLLVSADGHSGGPPDEYRDYLEARYHADLDALIPLHESWAANSVAQRRFGADTLDLIDRDGAIRGGGELGAYDLDRRLAELDREGVACEVLIPGHQEALLPFFSHTSLASTREQRAAGARAYHRRTADWMADAGGRLVGIGEPGPCTDLDETIAEMRWIADHGFVGIAPPGNIADLDLPGLHDPRYEPFWQACVELGLVVTLHAGYGFPQQVDQVLEFMAAVTQQHGPEEFLKQSMMASADAANRSIDQFPKDSSTRLGITAPRRIFWQLMLAGVFDRYPDLKLVFTEVRGDWVPDTLDVLDRHFSGRHSGADLALSPREYWHRHVYVAPSSPRRYEIAMREAIGVDRFMFGMDYPHPEGTWPNTREWIRDSFVGVSEADARLILGENAVECYGLDRAALDAIAQRIGPEADDLLGDQAVDERIVAQFHLRSGYLRPREQVDAEWYGEMIAADEAAVAAHAT